MTRLRACGDACMDASSTLDAGGDSDESGSAIACCRYSCVFGIPSLLHCSSRQQGVTNVTVTAESVRNLFVLRVNGIGCDAAG